MSDNRPVSVKYTVLQWTGLCLLDVYSNRPLSGHRHPSRPCSNYRRVNCNVSWNWHGLINLEHSCGLTLWSYSCRLDQMFLLCCNDICFNHVFIRTMDWRGGVARGIVLPFWK